MWLSATGAGDSSLFLFLVATTWHCNLACSYCFVEATRAKREQERLSPELAKRLVEALDDEIDSSSEIVLHLYGGEPLTNLPAMKAMVDSAEQAKRRFSFALTTSGTIVSDEILDLLDRGDFAITLSLDGPQEIHDKYRRTRDGQPTHARVLEFLRLVRERTSCWVRGSAVVRPGWSLQEATDYLRSLKVDAIKAQIVRVPDGSVFSLSAAERLQYKHDLEAAANQVIGDLEAGIPPKDGRFTNHVLQLLIGQNQRPAFCDVGEGSFGITPTGDVVPCVLIQDDELVLGHIEDEPSTWLEAGSNWCQSHEMREDCEKCPQLSLCGGGCPAIMPVCGSGECDLVRTQCSLARRIYEHFSSRPERLLGLVGIT